MSGIDPKLPTTARRGYRTLIEALDELVLLDPRRPYALSPYSDDLTEGFETVHVEDVGHAADAFAYWLFDRCGKTKDDFETIAYVGISDLRYSMVMFGAIKCGKKAMFVSPKNTDAQNAALLQSTKCTKMLCSSEMKSVALSVKSAYPDLQVEEIKPFKNWVAEHSKPFVFSKSYEEAKHDPIIVLHSSGSTGNPKPITLSNGMFAANLERKLPEVPGRQAPGHRIYDIPGGGKYVAPIPPFHMAGLMAQLYYPTFSQSAYPVLGPPTRPATAADIKLMLDTHDVRILFTVPAYIEHIASMPGGEEALAKLDYLMFSGGPLSTAVGDRLAEHVQIASFYGSIELGLTPFVMPSKKDWQWLEFHPDYAPTMEPYLSEEGTYELVLYKTGKTEVDEMRGTFWTSPGTVEHRTKDLFVPHPSKPGLWRFHGRTDDTVVLLTGDKWNPVPSENKILGCPEVGGCLAIGTGHRYCCVLLEPRDDAHADGLVEKAQPYINEANSQTQACGHILKAAVLKPGALVRAPKGTVVRKLSEQKLSDVIAKLYAEGPPA